MPSSVETSDWEIRRERPEDAPGIAVLNEDGFGPGRYAKSAYRLREGVDAASGLNFVAIENGTLRGSVRFWPIKVGTEDVLLLGPLAVDSAQRGRGIGISLMQAGIAAARDAGWRAILLVGDAPYYGRVGFVKLPPGRLQFPGPVDITRLLGLALIDGALDTLSGPIRRAQIDEPRCADGAPLG
ncbi:MAG TPA: N-acetyltransferase [Rhizomicrobium sp.]|jgi:predicted N-acetyltransferase YhbS